MIQTDTDLDLQAADPNKGLRPGFYIPKPFESVQVKFQKIRFLINSPLASPTTITASTILRFLSLSTTTTVGYSALKAIRFRYIELWEPYQTTTNPLDSFAGVKFYGTGATNTGTDLTLYASGATPDKPAHLLAHAPKGTLVGFWQNSASSLTICDVSNCSAGAYVDIAFDYIGNEANATTSLGPYAISAASAGLMGIVRPASTWTALGLNNF